MADRGQNGANYIARGEGGEGTQNTFASNLSCKSEHFLHLWRDINLK